MAFGGRELRLILSIQSYGTSNFAKVRRDIYALERAAKTANMNQLAVQEQMVRKTEQLARTQDRISRIEQAAILKKASLQNRAMKSELAYRNKIANQAIAIENAVTAKRIQVGRSRGTLANMQGTGTMKFGLADSRILTQRMNLENKISSIQRSGIGFQAQAFRNQASQLEITKKITAAKGSVAELDSADATALEAAGHKLKVLSLRYAALRKDAEKISATQAAMPAQIAAVESQLVTVLRQEELISRQKFEQAAALGRQAELVGVQEGQLEAIIARQAEIAVEVARISKEEALINPELEAQLVSLNAQNVALERQRLLAVEIAAEIERMGTYRMRDAAAADAAAVRQQRLQKLEAKTRAVAHVGRAAQFTGLIGTAGFILAGSAAANFNQQLTLAATQTRKVSEPLAIVVKRTYQLEHGFDAAGKHVKGILDLMNEFPATADDMAKSAYDIYSGMQVSFKGGLDLLKVFNQLAVATGGDLPTATNAGITVLNDFAGAGKNVNKTLNLMVSIIRFGRMHLDEFNQMLNKVAPAAQASGQSLKDVSGAMAFLTTRVPSQAQASTGLARLLQTFRDPDFQKGTFKFGVDITKGAGAVGKLKSLPVILNSMAKSFALFQTKGGPGQLFKELTSVGAGSGQGRQSRIEAINAYTLLIKNIKDYNAIQKLTVGDTTEFNSALKAMSASPGVRWEVFINQMRAFVIIIGEVALPVLLKFAGYLANAAHWFENLSKHTQNLIIKLGVFGSIGLLVGGTIVSLGANLTALIINLGLTRTAMATMGVEAEAAAIKTSFLRSSLQLLTGIGIIAIPIVIQLLKGGEPGLWMLLGSALAGAAGGFMIGGPLGAGVGAIALPLTIEIIAQFQKPNKTKAQKAYDEYYSEWKKMHPAISSTKGAVKSRLLNPPMSFEDWLHINPQYQKTEKGTKKHLTEMEKFERRYNKLLKGFNKELLGNIKDQQNQLQSTYDQQNATTNKAHQNALALEKAHANAIQAARENMNQKIKTAVDKLASIYDNFEQMNKQALGSIAQGPTMQGILGNIFGGINDTLRQFGVQIPIPFQILRQDLDQQMKYFKRWRKDLDKLTKRGVPIKLVQELQQMGPEKGISIAEGLLGTSPSKLNKYVKDYNTINKAVSTAAQTDMKAQLTEWEKHGKNIAWAIINGLSESAALLGRKFKTYVTDNFGQILRTEFATEVATAMKNAMEDIKAQAAADAAATAAATAGVRGVRGVRGVAPGVNRKWPGALSEAQARAALLTSKQPFRGGWSQIPPVYDPFLGTGQAGRPTRPSLPARTLQSVHYHDHTTINGPMDKQMEGWIKKRDFQRRTRGQHR